MTRTESMALIVVGCILILAIGAAGIILKFYEAKQDAEEAAAVFDGIQPSGAGTPVIIKEGSVWLGCPRFFAEPFETVVFIFRDGSWISFSTQHAEVIDCPVSWMVDSIVRSGRAIPDATHAVHNHFAPVGFTPGDRDARHYLVGKGFTGVFGIYYPASGRFREWED